MSHEINVPLRPRGWMVPNYANFYMPGDDADTISIPVAEIEPAALDSLAALWLDNLYASVNRPSPFRKGDLQGGRAA